MNEDIKTYVGLDGSGVGSNANKSRDPEQPSEAIVVTDAKVEDHKIPDAEVPQDLETQDNQAVTTKSGISQAPMGHDEEMFEPSAPKAGTNFVDTDNVRW